MTVAEYADALCQGATLMTDLEIRKWNIQNILWRSGDCLCSGGKRQIPQYHTGVVFTFASSGTMESSVLSRHLGIFLVMLPSRALASGHPACIICVVHMVPLFWETFIPMSLLCSGHRTAPGHRVQAVSMQLCCVRISCSMHTLSCTVINRMCQLIYRVTSELPWMYFPGVPVAT